MSYFAFGITLFFIFCCAMLLFLYIGHQIAVWQAVRYPDEKLADNKIAEGAIFALMGLLIALMLSGARERFDVRRALVIQEANSIESSYLRLDLLKDSQRAVLQHDIRQYLDLRISIYQKLPDVALVVPLIEQSRRMQQQIWSKAASACQAQVNTAACIVLLPAITSMIDLANTRDDTSSMHPPVVVLGTLVCLALLSAILSGYGMRKKTIWHSLHVLLYAATISLTIFIIVDLEYPRLDFIRVNYFNNILTKLADQVQKTGP